MAIYYVDNVSGNDGNSGDAAHPLATITYAVAQVVAGDTIRVVPTASAYTDYFTANTSGTAVNRITITSSTSSKPTITGASAWLFQGDYWTIENMDFTNSIS